jgi:hypothetical protein
MIKLRKQGIVGNNLVDLRITLRDPAIKLGINKEEA